MDNVGVKVSTAKERATFEAGFVFAIVDFFRFYCPMCDEPSLGSSSSSSDLISSFVLPIIDENK
jgi:hypothetical protein